MTNFDIIGLLRTAVYKGISDIHIKINEPPSVRISGKIVKTEFEPLTENDFYEIMNLLCPPTFRNKAFEVFDTDFSYDIPGVSRFRVNLSHELGKMFMVIRVISYYIPTIKELNLPKAVEKFATFPNGIVFITGATGSGKSSTLAALVNYINKNFNKHIITLEDPVEYIFTPEKSIITQRQLEIDTASFSDGVKFALRQDPDIILVGEIRDEETMTAALKAAETGHLILTTMHTNDSIQTINRVINLYDAKSRDYIRKQLAESLRATVSQRLVPRADGNGRFPACEILVVTPTVKDFILRDSPEQIYELVKKGNFNEMVSLNQSLFNLYRNGIITKENALYFSDNKIELQQYMRGVYSGSNYE